MKAGSVDRRVRKTKMHLRLALMELMSVKDVKSISVRELAERADINRGTFYIHYKDIDDLLQQLEDEMAEQLVAVCENHSPKDYAEDRQLMFSFPYMKELFRFIQENADLCKVLLGSNGDRAYLERIYGILRDHFLLDFLALFYPERGPMLEYFCSFIVPGNLHLALSWLESGATKSPDEMGVLAGSIILNGIGALQKA